MTTVATGAAPSALPTGTTAPAVAAPAVVLPSNAQAKPGDELGWKELAKYVGRDIELTTAHTPMRMVTILDAAPNEVTVEGSVQGGHVKNRIHPDGFIRAVLIR
jgi:hypothetical protein